jgi:hypothetical protein
MATINGMEYAIAAIERVGSTKTGAFWKLDKTSYAEQKHGTRNMAAQSSQVTPLYMEETGT